MAMEISGLPGSIVQSAGEQNTVTNRPGNRASESAASSSSSQDTVRFSAHATRMHALESAVSSMPVVDKQRVDAMRHDLASGEYQVDAPRTADKMLAFEQMLP